MHGFTRIQGMPEDLQVFWSKRRKAIVAKAGELGIPSLGNASRMAGVNKLTREGKSHDNDPEKCGTGAGCGEAEGFVEREELIASVTRHKAEIGREAIRELTRTGLTIFPPIWRARRPSSAARTWWRRRRMRRQG